MKMMKKMLAWILLFSLVFSNISLFPAQAADTDEIVINALDYGADPTGAEDSTQAIWDALQAAKAAETEGKQVTLEFPTGEYHIYKDKAQTREYHTSNTNSIENPIKTIGILVEEHENLTIDGNGSLFMMHGNMMALAVVKSENIVLRDFSWDFAVPTVVEMTVTGVGSNYTDYYIADCFPHTVSGTTINWSSDLSPYTGQPYWSGSGHQPDGRSTYAVVGYHPDDEMSRNYYPSDGPLSNVSSITELDENSVRVYYSSRSQAQSTNQKVGTVFELCGNAHRETAGAFTWESENVTAEEVNIHFMHGFGWLIQMSKDIYYKKCNLVPRENSGHITVSFADGIHASGAAGEIVIEDCNFSNTHDDPINLHGTFTRVESRNDDNTLTLKYIHAQQGGFPQYHVGDKVQFFTRDTLESTDGEKMYTVAEINQDTDESSDKKTMIVRFEETLPSNLSDTVSGQPKYVAENVTYAPAVTVRNCTFKNVATRGILCTTRNKVLIENNTFYNMSMATIYLSNDSDEWYESGPIRDMTIRNNTFYIKDIGRTAWNTAPAIYVHPVTKGGGLPDASNPIHKNITIEGNTFYMDLDRVVEAESVENLTFKNNKVYRMNPDVEIDIALADASIAAGETAALAVNATGNTNSGSIDNLFQFKKCKDVVIEGNTYDDGLKLCAVVDQDTINNGITVNDEEIAVVTSSAAVSESVTDIKYASTDASVATVDANGNITGVAAGTATIFAYYEWNGTMVRSNYVEVTVEGEGASEVTETIEIVKVDGSAADNAEVDMAAGTSVQFAEKDDKEVTWSVVDFETELATDKATIDTDGTLTAAEEGVVWVKATSEEGATDKVAVVIYGKGSYGLNPDFSITRGNENHSYTSDSIVITAEGSSDLWQWDNTLKNLFLYTPDVAGDNLRTSVKVDNLPVRESNKWDTASFILYSGDDDYYTIGKKSHFDGFATVRERAQTAEELGESTTTNNDVTTAWLGFSKVGNTINLDYSLDGETWTTVKTYEDATFGNDYKIGFGTWGTTRTVTFSEFKVGTADQSYAELTAVAIEKTTNARPTASDVSIAIEGTTATATYAYADADGDAQGTTLFRWTYEESGEEVTVVTITNSISVAGVDEISCQVYPVDAYGTPGTPSEVETTSFVSEATAELHSVAFNGQVVFERDEEKEVTVRIPEELAKVEMAYISVNNNVGNVAISKNGTALEGTYANSDSVVLEVADGDVIVITRDELDYTFTIDVIGYDITTVEKITIEALGLDVTPAGENAFFASADSIQGSGTIAVTVDEKVGSVEILARDLREPLTVTKEGNTYSADYSLVNGLNSFYVQSIAKDGITKVQYIINIVYAPDTEATLQDLKINGTTVAEFDANVNEYSVALEEGTEGLKVEATSEQDVVIRVNDEYVAGTVLEVSEFTAGTYDVYVVVRAADGYTKVTYHVEVFVEHDGNVEVSSMRVDGVDVLNDIDANGNVDAYVVGDEVELVVAAQDQGAVIQATYGSQTEQAAGTLEATFDWNKQTSVINVTVTARDGETTVSYVINLEEKPLEPSDSSKDYDVSKITYSAGSEVESGNATNIEGGIRLAFDNNANTYWHSAWSPSWDASQIEEYLWVQFDLEEVTVVDAIRYLPRPAGSRNGDITGYRVEGTVDGQTWTTLTEGSWESTGQEWKLAEFDAVEVIGLRLVATSTSADSGNNRFASAAELRVRTGELDETPVVPVNPFEDVYESDYYYAPILWAVEKGITDGWTDTEFAPNMGCTRGQVVTFLWRAAGEPEVKDATNPFTDVYESDYYYDAVLWAVEQGITDGWMPGKFAPDMTCTRGQIVTFIWRAAEQPEAKDAENPFEDVASNAYYYDAVLWAVENKITDGWTETEFAPEMDCTRGQIVTFLYRYYNPAE